jgi:hypothetical protein
VGRSGNPGDNDKSVTPDPKCYLLYQNIGWLIPRPVGGASVGGFHRRGDGVITQLYTPL